MEIWDVHNLLKLVFAVSIDGTWISHCIQPEFICFSFVTHISTIISIEFEMASSWATLAGSLFLMEIPWIPGPATQICRCCLNETISGQIQIQDFTSRFWLEALHRRRPITSTSIYGYREFHRFHSLHNQLQLLNIWFSSFSMCRNSRIGDWPSLVYLNCPMDPISSRPHCQWHWAMMKMVKKGLPRIVHDDDGQWDDGGDDGDCLIHYLNLFAYSLDGYYWVRCCFHY